LQNDRIDEGGTMSDQQPEVRRVPRWVKVFAVIGAVVIILFAVALLTGHGPSRHGGGH
jgi:hypothetical protein